MPEEESALREEVSAALGALLDAIKANRKDEARLVKQVKDLRRLLDQGTPVTTALSSESLGDTLPLLSRALGRSMSTSGRVRRALVRSMRAEETSIPAISRAFGVSHQRISNILRP